ncbi:MAG: quinolinate synthase NadA [Thermoanaerobaculaceae bacterium]
MEGKKTQDLPEDLVTAILTLKEQRQALLLAHYYQQPEIQDLADFVGDSLELARFAQRAKAKTIVFCGVRFMAETAKILNPDTEVLLPDLEAGCSLEESCPPEQFAAWRGQYPEALAVTYINCSAAVKALSDVIVTSSSAETIISRLPQDKPLLFAPDRHLGQFLAKKTGRPLILWPGTCVVHEQFSLEALVRLKVQHPQALVAAHPECPENILAMADHVGSTSSILRFVQTAAAREFIIATEPGIIHQMEKLAPGKRFLSLPGSSGECGCNTCPYMKRNTLENLYLCLHSGGPRIELDEETRRKALLPLQRMLELSAVAPSSD